MKLSHSFFRVLQIIVSVILLQSLFFKFSGQPVSVQLFSILGVEPFGRYALGVVELFAAILLLIPRTVKIGAITSTFIGMGAIFTHLIFIGIFYDGDITLFLLALVIFFLSLFIWIFRRE